MDVDRVFVVGKKVVLMKNEDGSVMVGTCQI